VVLRFQSHAGSIEARRWIARRDTPFYSFNPTLVRLRQGRGVTKGLGVDGFNPTLVRLRLSAILPRSPTGVRFQSHAGSIEAM